MKTLMLSGVALAVFGAVMAGIAAESTPARLVKEIGAETLAKAASKTQANFIQSKEINSTNGIPEKYWEEAIRKLKPVKVYRHNVNVVVVTKAAATAEEGLYICTLISSYIPQDGDAGFRFKLLAPDIYEYQRSQRNSPPERTPPR